MSFVDAKTVLDYLVDLWGKYPTRAQKQRTTISFYGGEPLLNFPLIQQVISYVEDMGLSRHFNYAMTSNCVLLDKYMDYIVEKDFRLVCSLDGDKQADSYRVSHDGSPSFDKVYNNIKSLMLKYPDYFRRKVGFNSVLHNLNSAKGVCDFIKREFDIFPRVSSLSTVGVRPDKLEEFKKTFKDVTESFYEAENYEVLTKEIGNFNPDARELMTFLETSLPGVFHSYADLFAGCDCRTWIPTGTCFPFTKKLFVKVDGKILQCERIAHRFTLGSVQDGIVNINPEEIAKKFNSYLDNIQKKCNICSIKSSCSQCLYRVDGIETSNPTCKSFMTAKDYESYKSHLLKYLYSHPHLYGQYINDVLLEL